MQHQPLSSVGEMVKAIAQAIVDHADAVVVTETTGQTVVVVELAVHPDDVGQVIGQKGKMAEAIRTVVAAAGGKKRQRFTLEIIEPKRRTRRP